VVLCGSSASIRYRGIHDNIGKQELRFIFRHKPLEGVPLPESSPRVLRDPPFIQCLVTERRSIFESHKQEQTLYMWSASFLSLKVVAFARATSRDMFARYCWGDLIVGKKIQELQKTKSIQLFFSSNKNVDHPDQILKQMSFVNFWKNKVCLKQGKRARKLLDHF